MLLLIIVYKFYFVFMLFLKFVTRSRLVRSHDNCTQSFKKNLPHCFAKQMHHFTFPSAVCEGSSFSASGITRIICLFSCSHPVDAMWGLIVALICVSLTTNDFEHLFMC